LFALTRSHRSHSRQLEVIRARRLRLPPEGSSSILSVACMKSFGERLRTSSSAGFFK
jgi:hypothetical protein